jgi:Zn-dependent protease
MNSVVIDGLIFYLTLVVLLTFHEFGHAWMALKCGDDTAKDQGRVSLNPMVHIDPIGTVLLPLLMIFMSPAISRYLVGWAKPVPVNPSNLRNPRLDDILVSMAGPWMNLLLAVVLVGLGRIFLMTGAVNATIFCIDAARLSLILCFFNLIPIPPLDGSHVVRIAVGMTYDTYYQFARYGFVLIIIVLQIPFVRELLNGVTDLALRIICGWFGVL